MTQADRDRLVALKKAKKKLITQSQAGEELGLSIRQVQRLLNALKERGSAEAQAKGDISTLLGGRHFYFALTAIDRKLVPVLAF